MCKCHGEIREEGAAVAQRTLADPSAPRRDIAPQSAFQQAREKSPNQLESGSIVLFGESEEAGFQGGAILQKAIESGFDHFNSSEYVRARFRLCVVPYRPVRSERDELQLRKCLLINVSIINIDQSSNRVSHRELELP